MAEASDRQPSSHGPAGPVGPVTVADIMRPPVTTTVQQNDHVAAAAYLMKRADASALVVVDTQTDQPIGIITEADITRAVADGKDLNEARIGQLMTTGPAVIDPATSIRDAARTMTSGRFRHLPVVAESGVIGMLDITDVCRALLDLDVSQLA
jgi:CBS domain-containing protein